MGSSNPKLRGVCAGEVGGREPCGVSVPIVEITKADREARIGQESP